MDRIVKGTHNLAGWCGNFSEVLNPAIKLHKTSILLMLN
jgi:hypothetical protein